MMRLSMHLAPQRMVASSASLIPPVDRAVVMDAHVQTGFQAMLREALRQGIRGAFQESLLAVSDWGFEVKDIQRPFRLWHGEEDRNIPIAMARAVASLAPGCTADFLPGEGHLSLFKKHCSQIVAELAG
jgi:pimeloyl-ACP methyl ester carboxylesterase